VASVGGSFVAVPDFLVALRDSSFWFSPTDSLERVKLSSVGFGGCKRGADDDDAPPIVLIH
jgi:hypothetical protein